MLQLVYSIKIEGDFSTDIYFNKPKLLTSLSSSKKSSPFSYAVKFIYYYIYIPKKININYFITRTSNRLFMKKILLPKIQGYQRQSKSHLGFNRLLLLGLFFISLSGLAQGPGSPYVDAGEDVVMDCGEECTELTADFLNTGETTSYEVSTIPYNTPYPFMDLENRVSVNIDDTWSPVINLPFDFCFFGDVYSQVVIGSNGIISFDVSQANGFCSYTLGAREAIPDPGIHTNAIMLFHDINPAHGDNQIGWELFGESPNRALVVSYYNVPYYNFSNPNNTAVSTFQMVLYETTNAIDFFVESKPDPHGHVSSPINGGRAVLGIQNAAGDQGYTPPGRNTGVWEATEEAWRFMPTGDSNVTFAWLDEDGEIISTDQTITVCPEDEITTYTAKAIWLNCNGDEITVSDSVTVTKSSPFSVDLGENQEFCDVPEYEILAEIIDGDPTEATFLWNTGETTQSITVSESGTYTVEVTIEECTVTESVTILLSDTPVIDLGGDQNLCDVTSYEITAELIVGDPDEATFLWNTGETTQSITVTEAGTYTVEVAIAQCVSTASVTINFYDTPIIDLGEDRISCFIVPEILDATPSNFPDPSILTYEWTLDGIVIAEATGPILEANEPGFYGVTVFLSDNCMVTDTVEITLEDNLEVSVVMEDYGSSSASDIEVCPNTPHLLRAITDNEGVSFQWYLNGDAIAGATDDTLEIILEPGTMGPQTYSVTIAIGQCTDSGSIDVRIYPIGNCVISQGLTPNGDGFNDTLDLTFLNDRTGIVKFQVFNRYGTLVYDQNNYINQWYGQTNDGKDLPTATYFYVIDLAGDDPVYGRQTTGWIYVNQEAK